MNLLLEKWKNIHIYVFTWVSVPCFQYNIFRPKVIRKRILKTYQRYVMSKRSSSNKPGSDSPCRPMSLKGNLISSSVAFVSKMGCMKVLGSIPVYEVIGLDDMHFKLLPGPGPSSRTSPTMSFSSEHLRAVNWGEAVLTIKLQKPAKNRCLSSGKELSAPKKIAGGRTSRQRIVLRHPIVLSKYSAK